MKHKTQIQVRFKDVDALGHVNNANHLSYFELARIYYFNQIIAEPIDWENAGMILKTISIDYKHPVRLHDTVFVYTACTRVGNTSFELSYKMVKEENGEEIELATGVSVIVTYSYKLQQSVPVPANWVERMKAYEES